MNVKLDSRPPRLCFIGALLGRNPGYVTTQGEILSGMFEQAGYSVVSASPEIGKAARLADIAGTMIRSRDRYDVVIIDVYGGASFVAEDLASAIGRFLGKRVVMLLHGGSMPSFIERRPRWCRRVLRRADGLVAPSEYLARAVRALGYPARVIPNVIDLSAYNFRKRDRLNPRLFWMRQFHPVWNPLMAVRLLAKLRQAVPDASLVMAGPDKGQLSEVRQEAARLGLTDSVRFPGFIGREEKTREGERSDIFINTNRVDNMPVAVVEAGAMGLPVVSTNVGGIPDLLSDGENGLLVPDDNVEAMAEAVMRLLDDPALAARLSANGRLLAERSAWENVRPQWEELFREITAGLLN